MSVEDTPLIATVSDVCSILKNKMGLHYLMDEDGDIRLGFEGSYTVWINFALEDSDAEVEPKAAIKNVRLSCKVKSSDASDYEKFIHAANEFNKKYVPKIFAACNDETTILILEQYVWMGCCTPDMFEETFWRFVSACSGVDEGRLELDL